MAKLRASLVSKSAVIDGDDVTSTGSSMLSIFDLDERKEFETGVHIEETRKRLHEQQQSHTDMDMVSKVLGA
jgi:hypothetical protein